MAFHWYGGSMEAIELESTELGNGSYFGLKAFGGDSTIFVAPQGLAYGWANINNDDLAFVDAIIKTLDNGLCMDTSQRFAVGLNYGGSLVYDIANSRANTFRAAAILSGSVANTYTGKTGAISLYVQHGMSEPGNPITEARTIRDRFVEANGCASQTAKEPAPGSGTHIKTEYKDCSSGKVVTFVAFDGVYQYAPVDAGSKTSWSGEEIWKFFVNSP
ncbi:hypothetical protein Poli38472_012814 [Pythium oligandrum]|uniref:Feruloyl esterase n=1 Tax=Pythium oligandrum TaxID=41045 RepID=A0A8K1CIS0_PYTOL|nr:hypothetical protein Poli38472_012814 [Pythium oligandrum]|eukprot:TMW64192.1 hypothetical protein Poli38472_012814 [Pythium oligandrum]